MGEIKIVFEIRKIIYRNEKDGYCILNVKLKEHPLDVKVPTAEPIVIGYFPSVHIKDEFESYGEWVDTGKNGFQFKSNISRLVFPETSKGMVEFLRRFVKGVGKVLAERIVNEFKEDTFNVITNHPDKLLNIKGLTEKKCFELQASIITHKDYEDVAVFLLPLGISHIDIVFIYNELGIGAIEKIKDNPYVLCNYNNINFKSIDNLAKQLNFKANSSERIKKGIMLYINNQMKNRGDMFIHKEDIIKNLSGFMLRYGAFEEDEKSVIKEIKITKSIDELCLLKELSIEKNSLGKDLVYISFYKYVEDKIVESVIDITTNRLPALCTIDEFSNIIKKYETEKNIKLANKQKEAIFTALNNRLSILSGGPGTGKTQTINAMIYCIKEIRKESFIELCAPTGRASKRMEELTGMKAKTIHRLIGLNSFTEEKVEIIDIEADFLIIDEASMIDAYVFHNLLTAISEHTRIVIVGDHEQLPSVGAGLILRDLIESEVIPTTILTEIFRQAQDSQIVMNSHKVIKGIKSTDEDGLNFDEKKKDFYFIKNKNVEGINKLILKSIDRLVKTGYKLDDIQVLSVMNKGDLGVAELNRKIQERFNPKSPKIDELKIGTYRYLRVNDRVMQTINNYDLGVFNGEVGKIVSMNIKAIKRESDFELVVDFGDKEVVYTTEDIHELVLAYAITVHKSQGSEFPIVVMPFHQSLSILLNRNIIYTGWTRAKERVICVGNTEELDKGIDRIDNTIRNSQVKSKLIKYFKLNEKAI